MYKGCGRVKSDNQGTFEEFHLSKANRRSGLSVSLVPPLHKAKLFELDFRAANQTWTDADCPSQDSKTQGLDYAAAQVGCS